ncbi:MAG: 3-oxoacyl-ACP synthase [Providencia sp.]|uniref:3-oxoacyl-ACP synthase n=1 Tax=Providencia sp. TaxID=589 RepID=UPI003F9A9F4B
MTNTNQTQSDISLVRQIKSTIRTRKYAHVDEINILWRHAMRSQKVIEWHNIMVISSIVCAIMVLIKYLSF